MFGWFSKKPPFDDKLTAVDSRTVVSSDGWKFRFAGNSPFDWKVEYSEGEKRMDISVEAALTFFNIRVSKTKGWLPPHENEPFNEADRGRASTNILQAMKFQKNPCKIV